MSPKHYSKKIRIGSIWTDPENIDGLEQITQMEATLSESLDRIQMHKKCLGNQLMSQDSAGEIHDVMHWPTAMSNEQQPSNMQWHHDGDDQQFMLSGNSQLLPQRNYSCSTETALQDYHGYFDTEKQILLSKHLQENSLNGLGHNSYLQLQLAAQYPYHSYGMNFIGEKFQHNGEVSLQEDHIDFQVNCRPGFDAELPTLVGNTGPCGVPLFDGLPYPQPKLT